MFKQTKVCAGVLAALGGALLVTTPAVFAQEQRIEITGSAIKRIDAETAVPVTVLKAEDLKAQGLTTIEQILGTLSGMQTTLTTSQVIGLSTGGASLADLRGIGANKTLVLLNGRRIANNAFDGSAPDLNMIPMAALERVEVLRDGASSLYGTDAIGGVINFITRKDYEGGTITLGYDKPQHKGGQAANANIGFGFGNLEEKGFNLFGFVDLQRQKPIQGTDRDFNKRYAGGLSPTTSPANYYQSGDVLGNPTAPSCAGGNFLIPAGDDTSCYMTTSSYVDYIPKSERTSGFLRGDLKLGAAHTLSAEYFISKSKVWGNIAGVPYGVVYQNPFRPDGTPNPYYPGNSGNSFTPVFTPDPNFDGGKVGKTVSPGGATIQPGYMVAKWRDIPNGPRGDENRNSQQRFVLALDGTVAGWDYGVGLTYNKNKVEEWLISGYNDGNKILEGILTGVINPYGEQSTEGAALISDALLTGKILYGTGKTKGVDAHASRELSDWFGSGKKAAIAFGAEYRKEDFVQQANPDYAAKVVASTGIDPGTYNAGDRHIDAVYTQLDLPVLKSLDLSLSVRYDKYSDFGSTTNPKVGFRFQPLPELVLRGAYSTGFRAPSLYELNAAQAYTNTSQVNDPVNCPDGTPITGKSKALNCNVQFQSLTGGNQGLEPEKSKTFTLGILVEPASGLSFGADYWNIRLRNMIGSLASDTVTDPANLGTFGYLYHRNGSGDLSIDGTACPGPDCGYIDLRTQNLGGLKTDGIDFSAQYRARLASGTYTVGYNGTWVRKYDYQDYTNGPWNHNVGAYVGVGPIFRWQHTLTLAWKGESLSAGITGHLKTGYSDDPGGPENFGAPEGWRVSQYATADVFFGWAPIKGLDLIFGIKNVTDRDPPLTYQAETFQAGYDPRFTDPTGRTYYLRATYSF